MKRGKTLMLLHLILVCYSFTGVLSKFAATKPFLSPYFCCCYGGIIALLGIYALAWQQIIKKLPLTTAFASKSITIAWGLIWGVLIFRESITLGKMVGVALVMAGAAIFSIADKEAERP